jgi:hypothetical protein
MVTIESGSGSSEVPSATTYLEIKIPDSLGNFVERISPVVFAESLSVRKTHFYLLATPTDAVPENDSSGVWFLRRIDPAEQGLDLGEAPVGWLYEGWVRHANTWLSTGKFSDPGLGDDFDDYSGGVSPPDFPGEDFLDRPPPNLEFPWILTEGDSIAVTFEPDPDPDEAPFDIKLLCDSLPLMAIGTRLPQVLNVLDLFPSGNAVFKRSDNL